MICVIIRMCISFLKKWCNLFCCIIFDLGIIHFSKYDLRQTKITQKSTCYNTVDWLFSSKIVSLLVWIIFLKFFNITLSLYNNHQWSWNYFYVLVESELNVVINLVVSCLVAELFTLRNIKSSIQWPKAQNYISQQPYIHHSVPKSKILLIWYWLLCLWHYDVYT